MCSVKQFKYIAIFVTDIQFSSLVLQWGERRNGVPSSKQLAFSGVKLLTINCNFGLTAGAQHIAHNSKNSDHLRDI